MKRRKHGLPRDQNGSLMCRLPLDALAKAFSWLSCREICIVASLHLDFSLASNLVLKERLQQALFRIDTGHKNEDLDTKESQLDLKDETRRFVTMHSDGWPTGYCNKELQEGTFVTDHDLAACLMHRLAIQWNKTKEQSFQPMYILSSERAPANRSNDLRMSLIVTGIRWTGQEWQVCFASMHHGILGSDACCHLRLMRSVRVMNHGMTVQLQPNVDEFDQNADFVAPAANTMEFFYDEPELINWPVGLQESAEEDTEEEEQEAPIITGSGPILRLGCSTDCLMFSSHDWVNGGLHMSLLADEDDTAVFLRPVDESKVKKEYLECCLLRADYGDGACPRNPMGLAECLLKSLLRFPSRVRSVIGKYMMGKKMNLDERPMERSQLQLTIGDVIHYHHLGLGPTACPVDTLMLLNLFA